MTDLAVRPAAEVAVLPDDPLAPYVEGWLKLYATSTQEAYARDLDGWRAYLAGYGQTLTSARRLHFVDWCTKLAATGYAQTTRARKEAAVTSFYDYVLDVQPDDPPDDPPIITRTPAHGKGSKRRTKPGAPAKPTPALTAGQAEYVLTAARARSDRDGLLVAILLITGCRSKEVRGIRVGDVRQEACDVVLAVQRKGEKADHLVLTDTAADQCAALAAGRPADEPLFVGNHEDGGLTRDEVVWICAAAGRDAGIPDKPRPPGAKKAAPGVTPHVLRTTAVNLLIQAGYTPQDAQAFMGHARLTTTELYFRRSGVRKAKGRMASTLARIVSGQAED
jgi:integrase/recombinase XerD